jgi:hypothetical protein
MAFKALITMGVALLALLGIALARAGRRGRDDIPELNKHPERLDQMLDPTDDA